jgi:hypothetical protein
MPVVPVEPLVPVVEVIPLVPAVVEGHWLGSPFGHDAPPGQRQNTPDVDVVPLVDPPLPPDEVFPDETQVKDVG